MFNSLLENIFWELGWENRGIKIDGKWLNNLRFTDDVALISQKSEELQKMANELCKASRKAGLHINTRKMVVLRNQVIDPNLIINGEVIGIAQEAEYSGQKVSFNNSLEIELYRRRTKAWKNFWALRKIYKSRILERCTLPVLTYRAQAWALTGGQTLKLAKTQIAMERSILGVRRTNQIRITTIRGKTKAKDCRYTVKKLKMDYAGHVTTGGEDRWKKRVMEWVTKEGRRKVGRPRTRWKGESIQVGGVAWGRDADYRSRWK